MDYLTRSDTPIQEELWAQIDKTVTQSASSILTGRQFIPLFGPLGIGVNTVTIDDADTFKETATDGILTTVGRKFVELPTVYTDFTLYGRDIQNSLHLGYPIDLTKADSAAQQAAIREDTLIFFGNDALEIEGLLTVAGSHTLKKSDWKIGENAFTDISTAITMLIEKGIYGTYSLVLSSDLYLQLHRLQPGTGLLEVDRIKELLHKRVYSTPILGHNKAVLVTSDSSNIDLVVGQDLKTAYLEEVDLNHRFRILETIRLRIKRPQSIVVFE
ncbi:MAG: bacteriocin family protein [Megasphaera sp.]|jgi:uncharacterized linocin/CFP29 family protein|nr:bacteriocin family protein [Megasphaera sp.]MCI1823865.1 bacteriocin family protein [Megasphaera sp.]